MSPWWRSRLRLLVTPEQTVLMPSSARKSHPVRVLPSVSNPGGAEIIASCLGEAVWKASSIEVVISNHYLHYYLSEPPGRLLGQDEEIILVKAGFRHVYGDEADNFRVRTVSQPPDAGVLGAALNESLVRSIEALLGEAGVVRYRIRTLLDIAVNRLPAKEGWWAVAEHGWISLLFAQGGAWRHISSFPCGPDWIDLLADRLDRAARLFDDSESLRKVWMQTVNCEVPDIASLSMNWDTEVLHPLMAINSGCAK